MFTHGAHFAHIAVYPLVAAAAVWPLAVRAEESPEILFKMRERDLQISAGGQPIATYVFRDPQIARPYFAHVCAPGGVQVTRHHPPRPGVDATDHDRLHPGIWLAFGDLSGHDSWRLKAAIRHHQWLAAPAAGRGRVTFAVRDRYLEAGDPPSDRELCIADTRYTLIARPQAYLLVMDSVFSSPQQREFYFGDQEEMGVGMRVATPLAVARGGRMLDSESRVNERAIWGRPADWCDYSGTMEGQWVGMTLMADPHNFRRSWMHARDYGFVAANPFGVRAFTKGEANRTVVHPGETLRLRFGVLLHASPADQPPDLAGEYAFFCGER